MRMRRDTPAPRSYLLKSDEDIHISEVHLFFNEERTRVMLDHYVMVVGGKRVTVGADTLLDPEKMRTLLVKALTPVVAARRTLELPSPELPPQE